MIVLDTNVVSEPLSRVPDQNVLRWIAEHATDLAITSITVAELRFGVQRMTEGRRRDHLAAAVHDLIVGAAERILPFDAEAADTAGRLRARRESVGRLVSAEDTMIAAICLAGGHALATRNTRDFDDAGVELHNPWAD
ncbi:type II toxin-antitoxin system VapC family toxin [Microcella alkalica]|uniref:type II toxin-antitoxin system VapC family toxin n=1 Tax=Microcella alkalica TaxID=355930 RepID=UPI00145F8CB8|nr:type II toxin-antitoxin system VapC family toxin [Microcella alkalica]